jgi:hypothetical protein
MALLNGNSGCRMSLNKLKPKFVIGQDFLINRTDTLNTDYVSDSEDLSDSGIEAKGHKPS